MSLGECGCGASAYQCSDCMEKAAQRQLATAQARIAALESALRRMMTCAADYDATVGDFLDEACLDTEHPMQCARVRMLDAEVVARAALTAAPLTEQEMQAALDAGRAALRGKP